MVEEMIKNYGTFYDPEIFDKIYNIEKNASFPLEITYETNSGELSFTRAFCKGRCIDAEIPILVCFFQSEDINSRKPIFSNGMSGYASKNKCNFGYLPEIPLDILDDVIQTEGKSYEIDKDEIGKNISVETEQSDEVDKDISVEIEQNDEVDKDISIEIKQIDGHSQISLKFSLFLIFLFI